MLKFSDEGKSALRESIINPLYIFDNILEFELPNTDTPYSTVVWNTLHTLFECMFQGDSDLLEYNVDEILNRHKIDLSKILRSRTNTSFIKLYIHMMNEIETDVKEMHCDVCHLLESGDGIDITIDNINKLLSNLVIDYDMLFCEIKSHAMFADSEIEGITKIIRDLIQNIVNELVNYREVGYQENDTTTENIANKIHTSSVRTVPINVNENESSHCNNDDNTYRELHLCECNSATGVIDGREQEEAATKEGNNMKCTEYVKDENGNISIDLSKKDSIKINNTKEKRESEELRGAVNLLDKKSGIKLKKHTELNENDDETRYQIICENMRIVLAKLLFIINNVDSDNYIASSVIFGTEIRKIKIDDEFTENSKWFDDVAKNPKDYRFKARFLSYILKWVLKNLTKIADACYDLNDDGKFIEYDCKIEYVTYTVGRACDLITNMLRGKDYSEDMTYFVELSIYLQTDKETRKKNFKKIEDIHEQSFLLSNRLKTLSHADQDISMDTILKLSYMVCTHDPSVKRKIIFIEGYRFKDMKTTKNMIEDLGGLLIDNIDTYKINPLFKLFIKSDPLVWSRWKEVSNELAVGIYALNFYKFIMNDRRIGKRISKITTR